MRTISSRKRRTLSRRSFVEHAMSLCLVPAWAMALGDLDAQPLARVSQFPQMPTGFVGVTPCGSMQSPARIATSVRLVAAAEPGEALHITGTIYQSDEVTPAREVVLFL
jgi:hypothetical protein